MNGSFPEMPVGCSRPRVIPLWAVTGDWLARRLATQRLRFRQTRLQIHKSYLGPGREVRHQLPKVPPATTLVPNLPSFDLGFSCLLAAEGAHPGVRAGLLRG
jgi:hypothetical protein